ncbi:MAG: Wzz/FepE/Etk N-terminal domain-containing protein [Pseudomonadota bacterium]|nr:Wzz/FepE/Etk N-terminal domain-containing protein [Pseudomonadota bacterium]
MNASTDMDTNKDDEVSLSDTVGVLWRRKWLIAGVTLAFGVAAGAAALIVPKSYVALSVVSPVSNSQGGGAMSGLGALASQFGGLASLAGVAMPGDSKKFEYLAVLQSEILTEKYIQDNNLLPIIFQSKWNSDRNTWKSTDPKKIPTLWDGNAKFKKKIRSVSNDTKTGLATITITWTDPKLAAKWANDLVKITNEYLRAKAIHDSEASLAYLNEQALKTNEVAIRQGIYSLIQGEINKVMMAKGSEEYALRVVDPAVAPEKPFSPLPGIWILFGLLSGLMVSVVVVIYGPDVR